MADEILHKEAYDSYRFLIAYSNFDETSPGYGLTLDRSGGKVASSIAGTGFMLSGLVIGVERKWDEYETNARRVLLTLKNFYENIPHYEGMFAHFVEFDSGNRFRRCEFSTIDTVLFVNGMLTADSYFDEDEIHFYAQKIYDRINWDSFVFERNGKSVFRMAYNDMSGGDYLKKGELGWIHQWNMFAEQLTMYILAAGSNRIDRIMAQQLFLGFDRTPGGYKGYQFISAPMGALFVHQYSHAWFDFDKYYDTIGYDWFRNSEQAVMGDYYYCQDQKNNYATFRKNLWGLSSCDGPKGYSGYGAPPFILYNSEMREKIKSRTDGTVAVYSILASLPFCPELVKDTTEILDTIPELKGPYGYYDSINLENGIWIGTDYLSIDKGITLLMIDNYYHQTTWKYYLRHKIIQKAIEKLAFTRKEE